MDTGKVSVTGEGELRIKVGRHFGLDEAVLCMRNCPHPSVGSARRVVFDLCGTKTIQTAGLGFMLMVKERCQLEREHAVIVYDDAHIGQMLYLSHFEEKFHLVLREPHVRNSTRSENEAKGEAA